MIFFSENRDQFMVCLIEKGNLSWDLSQFEFEPPFASIIDQPWCGGDTQPQGVGVTPSLSLRDRGQGDSLAWDHRVHNTPMMNSGQIKMFQASEFQNRVHSNISKHFLHVCMYMLIEK